MSTRWERNRWSSTIFKSLDLPVTSATSIVPNDSTLKRPALQALKMVVIVGTLSPLTMTELEDDIRQKRS